MPVGAECGAHLGAGSQKHVGEAYPVPVQYREIYRLGNLVSEMLEKGAHGLPELPSR